MRIAQISPLTEAVPPKLYGGTERVISWLTEELVGLGHDVTLFASGDSHTSAQARSNLAARSASRQFGSGPDGTAHGDAGASSAPIRPLRRHAFPSGLLSVFAVLAPGDALHHDSARPPRSARAPAGVHNVFVDAGDIDFEFPAAAGAAGRLGQDDLPRPARASAHPATHKAELSGVFGAHLAGEIGRSRHSDCRALRASDQDRGQDRQGRPRLFRRADPPADEPAVRRVSRRDRRCAEIGVSERRHCAGRSDRLARAVWLGDDRGHGLRHAGDCVQPRVRSGDH